MTNNLKAERTLTAEELQYLIDTTQHRPQYQSAFLELQHLRSQSLSTQQPMGEPVAMIVRIDGEDEIMWLEGSLEVGPGNYLYAPTPIRRAANE